jgi:hypothetical protein
MTINKGFPFLGRLFFYIFEGISINDTLPLLKALLRTPLKSLPEIVFLAPL